MKRIIISAILALLMLGSSVVLASDTSNAVYKTTIQISNSGTAVTNQVATVNISTTDEITAGRLDADALECALLTGTGGSDIVFMPSVNASYPWCMFVSSIGATSTLNQYLYTLDVTGGKRVYFPGSGGMTIADDATMEGGSAFSINGTGVWIDENFSIKKDGAIGLHYTGGKLHSTVFTAAASANISPTSGNGAGWNNIPNAYDGNTGTYASRSGFAATPTEFIQYNFSAVDITTVNIYHSGDRDNSSINVDVYYDSAWHDAYSAYHANNSWLSIDVNAFQATALRVSIVLNYGGSWTAYLNEVQFGLATTVSAVKTAGEYDVSAYANGGNWQLIVDGASANTTTLGGGSMPNTANNWVVKALYLEQFDVDVAGTNVCSIDWEYDTTFHDASGNGNDATPSFRSTPSDADLSGEVIAQSGLATASTPTAGDTESGWTMVTTTLAAPDNLFTQSASPTYGIGGFNFGDLVSGAASDAGQDATNWHYMAAFTLAISAGVFVFAKTHSSRMGRKGSLLIAAVTTEIVLVCFYLFNAISGLALIPFALIALLLVMWRKSPAPVD